MTIIHKLDDFIFEIFPDTKDIKNNVKELKSYFEKYYSYGSYKPDIKIMDDTVIVEIDTESLESELSDFQVAVTLCENRKFNDAKKILDDLIIKNPTYSDYHRVYGQMLSEEGNQEEAVNYLIEALRWNPNNSHALLMMANIFFKYKKDHETALKFNKQALVADPKNYLALTNTGATLLKMNKPDEAKEYFLNSLKVHKDFPNTNYSLSIIAENENNFNEAFMHSINSLRSNNEEVQLYNHRFNRALEIANKLISSSNLTALVEKYILKLEDEGGVGIEISEDDTIKTAAKIEYAENYNRKKHLLLYKSDYPAVEHLKMHELSHLDLAYEARKNDNNKLFISYPKNSEKFKESIKPFLDDLKKTGVDERSVSLYTASMFNGLNSQTFNTPIDLFIENFLYNNFPELRPHQFISLNKLIREGLFAVTDKKITDISPKDIVRKSKIYNIVTALQFRDLYGADLLREYSVTQDEIDLAQKFYEEYLSIKDSRSPGEEYELVQKWADELELSSYFELIPESEYRDETKEDETLRSSIEDILDAMSDDPKKSESTEKFIEEHKEKGTDMAVVMHMLDALNYFDDMERDDIKGVAYEIALLGAKGFHPDQDGYRLKSIPDQEFSGLHILAYYYVSWKLAIPDMLNELQLPYDKEFELAEKLFKREDDV